MPDCSEHLKKDLWKEPGEDSEIQLAEAKKDIWLWRGNMDKKYSENWKKKIKKTSRKATEEQL